MGYIHCCGGLRKARSFSLKPSDSYIYAQADYLDLCPICGHTVIQITRIDDNYKISSVRKTNKKARMLFAKIKKDIIREKNPNKVLYEKKGGFYLNYNEFGKIKKCFSNLSTLKIGLFENK